jgi:hypothetical protein
MSFYNDLLFEIYHYIPKSNILLLNKSSKCLHVIDGRIKRYVYHKQFNNLDDGLYEGCKTGDMMLVKEIIKKGTNNRYRNWGLSYACEAGHMKLVKFIIKNGANDWDCGLFSACRGADDWNLRLTDAYLDGIFINNDKAIVSKRNCHMKIAKLMIKKGATECLYCDKSIQEHLLKK